MAGFVYSWMCRFETAIEMRRFLLPPGLCLIALSSLRADVVISEFLAENINGIEDENGNREDWIELFNTGTDTVNLDGWWLTDNSSDPTQWSIPDVNIPAKGHLLIWASGNDRASPVGPLHTNFSLRRGGEFLGLYKPPAVPGGNPELVFSFGASFPAQAPDVSYGISISQTTVPLVAATQSGRYRVLTNDAAGSTHYSGSNYAAGNIGTGLSGGWNVSPAFNDSSWPACTTGLGYDTSGDLTPWISTDCQAALLNVNTSLLFRRTFNVPNPDAYASYQLRMKYEDGFVAYLNGTEIGRANFSGTPAYNSKSSVSLDETIVNSWTEFTFPASVVLAGSNVLAIQGLNSSASSSDFLLLPEITGSSDLVPGGEVYFSQPTPNSLNGLGSAGPVVYDATPVDPLVTRPLGNGTSPPMKVTVRVIRTKNSVTAVRAIHRTMWNGETIVSLNDAGDTPDTLAGDGIYSGNLPTTAPTAGQMFRWRFEAQDSAGMITKLPAYADPLDSPQYFGTVAVNSSAANSQLPVLDWFVEGSPTDGPTTATFRGSCFYLNRFYDNIDHEIHGQSTVAFKKKSYDFDSNDDFRFVWKEGERPVKDLNLLSNYADKTKTRNTLAQEVSLMSGTPYHFAFPIRVHLNGAFHGVMDLVEDGDDRMLDRNGLDGDGALYKIYDSLSSTANSEKKTRKEEDKSDLQALIDGLDPATSLATRRTYSYDNVNLAATVNYLATRTITSDRDHGFKNYYVYRDTNITREWRPIIWDVDLSFGHDWNYGPGYFDDAIYHVNPIRPTQTEDNGLYRIIAETPEFRSMYLRRLRTLMDSILQPPGTTNGLLETRMREIVASVDPDPANPSSWTDGDRDASRWGVWGRGLRPREETEYVIANHFAQRRAFLFDQNNGTRQLYGLTAGTGDPIPSTAQANTPGMVSISSVDFLPVSGNQNQEYIILKNTTSQAVDLSGWTMDGGIDHKFEGGTVIPAGNGSSASEYKGLLHLVKDAAAFRSRTTGPTGGQKRLVQGNYTGQLSARGETVNLRDTAGQLIATFSYSGTPTVLQRFLRISEIQYHPAEPSLDESTALLGVTDGDFEYLEFVNIGPSAIDLTGARFSQGIGFTFPSTSLAAGGRIILAKNPEAFALRHPDTTADLLGPYEGDLDNAGERLELSDAVGENILDFTYKDGWYPNTDGSGHSLVIRDPGGTPYNDFGNPVVWAISGGALGSPGFADTSYAQAYRGWDNFHFTALERGDPLISGPEADPDQDGRKNSEEYALGTDPRSSDLPVLEFTWSMDGPVRRPALRFRRPLGALDVKYELLGSETLGDWSVLATTPSTSSPLIGSIEEAVFRDTADDSSPSRFLRLRYTLVP